MRNRRQLIHANATTDTVTISGIDGSSVSCNAATIPAKNAIPAKNNGPFGDHDALRGAPGRLLPHALYHGLAADVEQVLPAVELGAPRQAGQETEHVLRPAAGAGGGHGGRGGRSRVGYFSALSYDSAYVPTQFGAAGGAGESAAYHRRGVPQTAARAEPGRLDRHLSRPRFAGPRARAAGLRRR